MNRDHPQVAARLILTLLLILCAGRLHALPEDREQPIRIESDRAEYDQRKGITIYQGDVRMTQGSLLIKADKVTIHTGEENPIERLLAEGSPAHFEQKLSVDKPKVVAQANRIRYNAAEQQLILIENARMEQDQSTMSGDQIDYDLANDIVTAESREQQRIEVVIPPQNQTEQD